MGETDAAVGPPVVAPGLAARVLLRVAGREEQPAGYGPLRVAAGHPEAVVAPEVTPLFQFVAILVLLRQEPGGVAEDLLEGDPCLARVGERKPTLQIGRIVDRALLGELHPRPALARLLDEHPEEHVGERFAVGCEVLLEEAGLGQRVPLADDPAVLDDDGGGVVMVVVAGPGAVFDRLAEPAEIFQGRGVETAGADELRGQVRPPAAHGLRQREVVLVPEQAVAAGEQHGAGGQQAAADQAGGRAAQHGGDQGVSVCVPARRAASRLRTNQPRPSTASTTITMSTWCEYFCTIGQCSRSRRPQ